MQTERATADLLERIKRLEKRVKELEGDVQPLRLIGAPLPTTRPAGDCGCQPNSSCNNVMCPRRITVTYGVGFPD